MTADRWQHVQTVFLGALEREASQRESFLDEACIGDAGLRREVDSLLTVHDSANNVLDKPVAATTKLDQEHIELLIGQTIGPYRVEREIGRGGMGEVYLARDTRLDRPVAIKLLPASLSDDPDRVRRFRQEARAASSLNHPNIVTIHDIAESERLPFIVAEYIEGKTLREAMRAGLQLDQALDIFIQTASALNAAHNAGITHRDIKPENIMVRHDGYVKVLDFGLAKLTEPPQTSEGRDLSDLSTRPGVIMGTVKYMSPEQARGQKVDQRTDIFSLGVVLYEAITGSAPFDGETISHTIVAILEREPPPISEYVPDAPIELQSLIEKALQKDKEDRYQTTGEMLTDLREIRQELQIQARQDRSGAARASDPGRMTVADSGRLSTGDYIVSEITQHRLRSIIVAMGALLILAGFGFGMYVLVSRKLSAPPPSFEQIQFRKLTAVGLIGGGVISADGRLVAYVGSDEQGRGLWIKQESTGKSIRLVPIPISDFELWFFNLSPNGEFLYFITEDRKTRVGGILYRVPTIGGTPERIKASVSGPMISPDSRRLLLKRAAEGGGEELFTANNDGDDEHIVTRIESFAQAFNWAPDGKSIAIVKRREDAEGFYWEVVEIPITGGTERILMPERRSPIYSIAYLPERKGLLLIGRDEATGVNQIWFLPYPNGELHRVTRDLIDYTGLSITADGQTALVTQSDTRSAVWSFPLAAPDRAKQLTGAGGTESVAAAPDGKIIYSMLANGEQSVWEMNGDGSQARPLISNSKRNRFPCVSPDNRYIVFASNRTGHYKLWRADRDGRNPIQLSDGELDFYPYCSPDSRWVVYVSKRTDEWAMWKISIDGGAATRLAVNNLETTPAISPDGKLIAYEQIDNVTRHNKLVTMPFNGGEVTTVADSIMVHDFRWTRDGRELVYVSHADGSINLWIQPISGGPPRRVTKFSSESIGWFDLTRDGEDVVCVMSHGSNDLVLISNLK